MNFQIEFQKGQQGKNSGLSMGEGLDVVDTDINGVQKGMIYAIGAAPKVGKTTLTDNAFVIGPYLDALEKGVPLDIIYFSYEIDRISKEFDFTCHFLDYDHDINEYKLPDGVTVDGEKKIGISSTFLRGRLQDDNKNMIPVPEWLVEKIITVYRDRIKPLFGDYDENGKMITSGAIKFFEEKENPTGLRNHIMEYAEENGEFVTQSFYSKKQKKSFTKIMGYKPHNPDKYTIIVTDHLRKLTMERGFQMKQNVDKFVEYSVEFRNWCKFTFIHIIHLNRGFSDTHRLNLAKDQLYPNGDDFKDTGNLSEEADYVFTMMDPNDGRYNLTKHFGKTIKDSSGNPLYPHMRTIHLVDSRHCYFPRHYRLNMNGGLKKFYPLESKEMPDFKAQV